MTESREPRLVKIPFGNPGVRQTVGEMWAMILTYSPAVREKAERILRAYRVQFASNTLQAAAIYDWVQGHLAYVGDHVLVEEIRGPEQLLEDIASHGSAMGDCDDFVNLLGALFSSIGIPFSVAYVSATDDGVFGHVFLNLQTSSGLVVVDAIGRDAQGRPAKFGWHVPWDLITAYEEWPMPASYEALGMSPEGALIA